MRQMKPYLATDADTETEEEWPEIHDKDGIEEGEIVEDSKPAAGPVSSDNNEIGKIVNIDGVETLIL